jgi:cell division protein FtsB
LRRTSVNPPPFRVGPHWPRRVVMPVSPDKDRAPVTRAKHRRTREARRSRFLLIGGALLSAAILGAWFPANALYHQHSSLASANAQLSQLHQQDAALAQERKNLSSSAEIARIAREQDQLVSPGQQAFEVLPASGTAKASAPYAGDPALTAPVAPSSASELPPGAETGTTQPVTTTPTGATSSTSKTRHAAPASGVLGRIVNTLEFWR